MVSRDISRINFVTKHQKKREKKEKKERKKEKKEEGKVEEERRKINRKFKCCFFLSFYQITPMLMTEFTRLTNKGQRQRHLGIRRQQPGKSCSHLIPIAGRMSIVALLKNKRVFQKSKIKNQKNQKIIENQKNCPGINHVRSVDFIIRSRTTFPFWSKTLFLIDMALHGFLSNFIG